MKKKQTGRFLDQSRRKPGNLPGIVISVLALALLVAGAVLITYSRGMDKSDPSIGSVSNSGVGDAINPATQEPLVVKLTEPETQEPLVVERTEPAAAETVIHPGLPELFSCITVGGRANWEIQTQKDGSFQATFRSWDWGDQGTGYANGTCYITEVTGVFTDIEKRNDDSYKMVASQVHHVSQKGDSWIQDNVRYVVEEGSGIADGDEYFLYLPGTMQHQYPQGLVESVNNSGFHSMTEITPDTFVLYHPNPESPGYALVYIGKQSDAVQTPAATEHSGDGFRVASTFGYEKAWVFHDRSGTDHLVTSLAFREDGTFHGGVGIYLSDWLVCFKGTYQEERDGVTLRYMLNGAEETVTYQVNWESRTLRQASETSLVIPHQIGSEFPLEEDPWNTAERLLDQVETFIRYAGLTANGD